MPDSERSKFEQKPKEPLFTAISNTDPDFQAAYAEASRTLPRFTERIQSGVRAYFSAKLRFVIPMHRSAWVKTDSFSFG